jgi:hypothetical protein
MHILFYVSHMIASTTHVRPSSLSLLVCVSTQATMFLCSAAARVWEVSRPGMQLQSLGGRQTEGIVTSCDIAWGVQDQARWRACCRGGDRGRSVVMPSGRVFQSTKLLESDVDKLIHMPDLFCKRVIGQNGTMVDLRTACSAQSSCSCTFLLL